MRKGYVDTRDGQVHYRVTAKAGGTPIVCLHQTASSSAMYDRLMVELAPDFDVWALDTPGFGESFSPRTAPTMAYYAETLWEALTHAGVERCMLFGHHTGAALAAEMAAMAPARTERLMLCGPTYYAEPAMREERGRQVVKPFRIEADGSHLLRIWHRVKGGQPGVPLALSHRETVDALRAGERWPEAYAAVFAQDLAALLPGLSMPILLLCGRDDLLWPRFEEACAALPAAAQAVLPGGSFVMDEHPAAVADAIRQFVKESRL